MRTRTGEKYIAMVRPNEPQLRRPELELELELGASELELELELEPEGGAALTPTVTPDTVTGVRPLAVNDVNKEACSVEGVTAADTEVADRSEVTVTAATVLPALTVTVPKLLVVRDNRVASPLRYALS
jgi:hypothetical protein